MIQRDTESLLAIDNPALRRGLHDALKAAGFNRVTEASNGLNLHKMLEEAAPDLIIATSEMEGMFTGSLVADLRNHKIGRQPFSVIVMLSPVADHDYLKRVIDSGPDDVLLMPVAPGLLLSRIRSLAKRRKPFVVTHDYTGPDRRRHKRVGEEQIPLVDVPNPLNPQSLPRDAKLLNRLIGETCEQLNQLKLGRYAVQIKWLSDAIGKALQAKTGDAQVVSGHAVRLCQVAEDIKWRAATLQEIVEHATALDVVAQRLAAAGRVPDSECVDKLEAACRETVQALGRLG